MANSDLSTDLSLERLLPAASVRGTQAQPSKKDAERSPRRKPPSDEPATEDAPGGADHPQHQIDSLA
jgi:hypothetical protein